MKSLRQVTDRFSLFNDGRKLGANKRNYIIKSVQNMIASDATQEALRLGEAFGFYGHQPRQRANKLNIGETEVITINGRPVVVENIPSNRTVSLSCSDDGIVTHTEEILDTDTGKIVASMQSSGAGGWSWATGGRDTRQQSVANSYHGMDYVLKPNYLSLDHPTMMLESAERETMLLESLQNVGGFDEESAHNIVTSINGADFNLDRERELETEVMYLEGLNLELSEQAHAATQSQARFKSMMLEAVNRLPFYLTDAQKLALSSMENDHDFEVINAMFESIGANKLKTLPTGMYQESTPTTQIAPDSFKQNKILFSGKPRF